MRKLFNTNIRFSTLSGRALLGLAALSLFPISPAHASWVSGAHVTLVFPSYMPASVPFQIDQPVGGCPAGTWISWLPEGPDATSQQQNSQAVFGLLTAAKISAGSPGDTILNRLRSDRAVASPLVHLARVVSPSFHTM